MPCQYFRASGWRACAAGLPGGGPAARWIGGSRSGIDVALDALLDEHLDGGVGGIGVDVEYLRAHRFSAVLRPLVGPATILEADAVAGIAEDGQRLAGIAGIGDRPRFYKTFSPRGSSPDSGSGSLRGLPDLPGITLLPSARAT